MDSATAQQATDRGPAVRGTRLEGVGHNLLFGHFDMIRSFVLAASAIATLVAVPASAQEVRIKVAGRPAAEVRAEIVKAASTVCWKDVRGEALAGYLYPACIRASVNDAVAKINSPALSAYNTANPFAGAVVSR